MITESADGVVIVNRAGLIEFVNPSAESLLGRSTADLLGQPFGYDVSAHQTAELRIESGTGKIAIVETRPVETRWMGQPALLITLRDITAHKRAEASLRRYTHDLQARNEELDAFAHTVAHDLKTPLGVILGFAEVLESEVETMPREEMATYLRSIGRNTRKVDYIIQELLLLASVRKEDVEPRPLNMAHIVAEVQERLTQMAEIAKAELILPTTWPIALGHGPWIEEVWANYLSNAIKYGGSPPRVELGASPQANGTVVFWVTDNGQGLTAAERAQLFTPFGQLNKVRAQGNGLGLSIVRRIIDRLDGRVGVRSEPGQGSTFFFSLPAAE
jgi:signal transduction histidine kinase